VSENYFEVKYSLYVANAVFRAFIDGFRNLGGAKNIVDRINFQEELCNLEQSGRALLNRICGLEPHQWSFVSTLVAKFAFMIPQIVNLKPLVLVMAF
jgi:hypothetical protein